MRRWLSSIPYVLFIFALFLCLLPSSSFALEDEVYIEINKTTNQLTIFLNDISVYTFPVGTGKNKHLTPEGEFTITTRVKEPWYLPKNIAGGSPRNPLGTRWLGLNVPGTGGYKYGIHGTNNPASIGHNVSQGCIRMHNEDIEWLYRNIPLGTRVIIKSNNSSPQ
ncbi:L,D-transpeptidase [Aneurinibacillus migulanus]|uniref:L,D-transpeptidase catalytic domain n=1 Tax=Aneurinibacillus migulanus TaxID=47500 RepID=A0A1G8PPE1_ANEMI|nr:L,D-transpeptidase [Aneurinibacillus migulanus]MCP1354810.1 L,D-transpeptidase [Aneurinibacillus migulanus]MED0892802.1 L,D-transpeptidase [Aneurinibacillus migulanus]MED1619048.1 L,D-transpeptidase [Aneurinibacillus migulanus]MED4729238.1 L,D-transpeptidase [Aneurinibacillus migulanus]SDI94075.1 L,D-transpeptidase catalytic domain [Aneurinibacillus migulanus]